MKIEEVFRAYDIRGKVRLLLKDNFANKVGRAFADWLPASGPVAVGRDMRPDSKEIASELIKGLLGQGRDVIDLGLITSDMLYFSIGKYELAGGAVVTASHNPGEYNGIKFYREDVIPVGLDSGLDMIRNKVLTSDFLVSNDHRGEYRKKNINNDWVKHCLTFIDITKLKHFHLAIDAGNGMAGKILPKILNKLPINTERLYFELDGSFPNHEANPQNLENLNDLINVIKAKKLDFGIAFDGDGDRVALVDDLGRPVLGTDLISIVARYFLEKHPKTYIVHEVRTSRATTELIKKWGGKPLVTKAGRIYIGRLLREKDAIFGGETTGHLFFKDNYNADSGLIGALVALQAISDSNKKLSELVDEYRLYELAPEINFGVKDKIKVLSIIKNEFTDCNIDEIDGLSVSNKSSWFNIRISNTEPVIRLNVEAKTKNELNKLLKRLALLIESVNKT